MSVKTVVGVVGLGAVMVLGACQQEEMAVATTPEPVAECQPLPGVYAEVRDARPVYYAGEFDPGYIAVTDTTQIQEGAGQPNAIQYVVVTNDGRQLPLVAQEQYRRGDQLYIEPDTCDRARVTVIQELG